MATKSGNKRDSQFRKWWKAYFTLNKYGTNIVAMKKESVQANVVIDTYVNHIIKSSFFKKTFPHLFTIDYKGVIPGRIIKAERAVKSDNGYHASIFHRGTLSIPSTVDNDLEVIRAIAYMCCYVDDAWHGPSFARAFLLLLKRFVGTEAWYACKVAYKQNKIKYRIPSDKPKAAKKSGPKKLPPWLIYPSESPLARRQQINWIKIKARENPNKTLREVAAMLVDYLKEKGYEDASQKVFYGICVEIEQNLINGKTWQGLS